MKFFLPLFAAGAIATTVGTPVVKNAALVRRDLATITSAVSSISDATTKLDDAINAYSQPSDAVALSTASTSLLSIINDANSAVSPLPDLSSDDAVALAAPVGQLATLVNTTITDLINKKSTFVSAGIAGIIYQQLQDQSTAANTFSATVLSKIPDSLSTIAQNVAKPISDALAAGVAAYADQASAGGSAGGSTDGGSSTPAASATSSADGSSDTPASTPTASATSSADGSSDSATSAPTPAPTPIASDGPCSSPAAPVTLSPSPTWAVWTTTPSSRPSYKPTISIEPSYSYPVANITMTPTGQVVTPTGQVTIPTSPFATYTGAAHTAAAGYGVVAVAAMMAAAVL